jgi:mannose/cellobiose epimerase-like protein (N-acyl-D-glucosamine 2-epimerase family)
LHMSHVPTTQFFTACLSGEVMAYRGQNPVMHCVEALLAAYQV